MLSTSAATVGLALENRANGDAVVAVAGPEADARALALWRMALASYRPGKVVTRIGSDRSANAVPAAARAMYESSVSKGASLAFVCAGTACATPVATPIKLAATIRTFGVNAADQTKVAGKPAVARPPM
jgi:uncharacterized protein YyaL (SSP411 family)